MGEQWFVCQDGASKFVVKFRFDVWVRGGLGPLGRVGRMDSTARYLSGAPRLSSPESVVPGVPMKQTNLFLTLIPIPSIKRQLTQESIAKLQTDLGAKR